MFLYHQWIQLPLTIRQKIASDFGIQKTGSTHVVDNVVQSDGYAIHDVEKALTHSAICSYTGILTDDTEIMWKALVIKAQDLDVPQASAPIEVIQPPKKRGGRPKGSKNNAK